MNSSVYSNFCNSSIFRKRVWFLLLNRVLLHYISPFQNLFIPQATALKASGFCDIPCHLAPKTCPQSSSIIQPTLYLKLFFLEHRLSMTVLNWQKRGLWSEVLATKRSTLISPYISHHGAFATTLSSLSLVKESSTWLLLQMNFSLTQPIANN